jgi:hypothetical protein
MNYPKTKDEAQKYKYGQWAGRPAGYPYKEGKCAAESLPESGQWFFRQCARENGHGPDGLYCKQHALYCEQHAKKAEAK